MKLEDKLRASLSREAERMSPADRWPEIENAPPPTGVNPSGRRVFTAAVALGVFAAVGWLTWSAFRPGPTTTPGSADSGTYLLSRFEVGPYTDPATEEIVPGKADVTFTFRWSSEEYPGVHRCELRVWDPAGSEIGSLSFQMSALSEPHRSTTPIPVTGSIEGATATGSCGLGRLDVPVAYVISNEHLGYVDGRLAIIYDVARPEGVPADREISSQACTWAAWDGEGRLLGKGHGTLTAPPGEYHTWTGPDEGSVGEVAQGTVNCVPYVHEGEFPDPKPPPSSSP
jgi:hypothetical protein